LLVAVGCARPVSQKKQGQEAVVGTGRRAIDRDGWQRQLSVDIANDGNAYGGSWMSVESQPGIMLDRVEVQGDEVRFGPEESQLRRPAQWPDAVGIGDGQSRGQAFGPVRAHAGRSRVAVIP